MRFSRKENVEGALPAEAAGEVHPEEGRKPSAGTRRALIGGGLTGLAAAALLGGAPAEANQAPGHDGGHHHGGPLDSATVSFGGWMTGQPLDRFPNLNPIRPNHHGLCPGQVTIKSGGCVNFVIGGFHLVLVYDDGTQPGEIDISRTIQPTNQPRPLLIADANRRIYRGFDPSLVPQDRVEVVHFERPGTYLVICGVFAHFVRDSMFGYVRVLP